jgi:hypothetical protein
VSIFPENFWNRILPPPPKEETVRKDAFAGRTKPSDGHLSRIGQLYISYSMLNEILHIRFFPNDESGFGERTIRRNPSPHKE